ncbi:hypothetical protein [Sphingomonas gilva]|uniref:hypothetical protein n=1 Tax=Sphingomonas gilva TaxID=2305907 RepID=UPI001CA3C591|nr:hypothetical protein [Sphingomonas gilva]
MDQGAAACDGKVCPRSRQICHIGDMPIRSPLIALARADVQPRGNARQTLKTLSFAGANDAFPGDFVQPAGCGSDAA